MDFKSLLSQLDQLNEATEKTKTGLKHTAEPGGYGRKDDEDDEGKKVKADAPKRGRGRPKKGADSETGEEKKFDTKSLGAALGAGQKPKKEVGTVSKKHRLKEYFDSMDKALNEMMAQQPIPVVGKAGQTQQTGAGFLNIDDNSPAGQAMKDAIGKLAQQKKAQIVVPTQQQKPGQPAQATQQQGQQTMAEDDMDESGEKWIQKAVKHPGALRKKLHAKPGEPIPAGKLEKATHSSDPTTARQARLAQTLRKISKTNEADMPPNDSLMSPISEQGVAEGKKKPDANKNGIPDYAEDGKGKNDLKKKKVDEGMNHKLQSARLAGKAHALAKEGYNCRYDDMEEARHYHEGYKEGLDECYGQMPIQGYVGEEDMTPATVPGMASQADGLDEMDRSEWMKHKAKVTPGDKFNAFGQTFADKEVLESPFAFEAWDKELNALLESKEEVTEGMTVSISKGQQGAPDSVSVSAQDAEADQLLSLIKHAGLGLFGGDEAPQQGAQPMTVDTGEPAEVGTGGVEIGVVDDHDGMMNLIKKVTGAEPKGPEGGFADQGGEEDGQDYEEEGGHDHEDTCEGCGMEESACSCDHEETVDEDETMDQREEEVAEDQTEEEETSADENAEAAEDEASANYDRGEQEAEGASYKAAAEEEKDLDESYANGADDTFETDINFMTKVISGGLNKQKSTGQTTQPVIAGQNDRMGYNGATNESVNDWKKLAGIK